MKNPTIAAISTPLGAGGIGIIRISGSESLIITEQMFRSYSGKKLSQLKGYSGMLGEIIWDDHLFDQAIIYRYIAPKSYTGEDIIEISCHGGSWVTSQILRIVLSLGAVPAEAGEFTKRAFFNGKIDLIEAEAVMDIINAEGEASLKVANDMRAGKLSTEIKKIVEKIIDQSAHLAAWADYPDEEMEMLDESILRQALVSANEQLDHLIKSYDYGRIIKEGIATAIVGKPNVGKSTLMNILSGYETSIVSNIPGTTRDVVKESIRLGRLTLQLSDTAGIRETTDEIEQVGVQRAIKQIKGAELILALFDNSERLNKSDMELIELIKDKNVIVLINKSDLEAKIDLEFLKTKFKQVIIISAKNSKGIEGLEPMVESLLNIGGYSQGDATIIANERQRQCLVNCKHAVGEAIDALDLGITLDAVGVCIEDALGFLMLLTGQRVQDEVVTEVFANFCVGK